MNTLPKGNPKPPEHINNKNENPLKDFLILAVAAIAIVSLIGFALAQSATWLAPHIPYEWEVKYLQGAVDSEGDLDSGEEQSLAIQGYLSGLTKALAGENGLQIKVHFLPEEMMPNAFATLGGHIFVTQGLLDHVESENGLAMVLAHEYAHIELRHPAILMLEQLSFSLLFNLMGSNAASVFTEQSAMLTVLAYSRNMERAADTSALTRLQNYYGHTYGAEEFFVKVHNMALENEVGSKKEKTGSEKEEGLGDKASRLASFLQTHPDTEERIALIKSKQAEHESLKFELTPLNMPAETP